MPVPRPVAASAADSANAGCRCETSLAYREVQAGVESAAQGGDYEPIDESAMRALALSTLRNQDTPTIYRPEVLAAVDASLAPGASTEQRLQAYDTIQGYVDGVGGIGDAGINAEALPARTAVLLGEAGIPTRGSEGAQAADAVVEAMEDGDDDALLEALETAEAAASDPQFAAGFYGALSPEQLADLDVRLADIMQVQRPSGHAGRSEAAQERYQADLARAEVASGLREQLIAGFSIAVDEGLIDDAYQREFVEHAQVGTLVA